MQQCSVLLRRGMEVGIAVCQPEIHKIQQTLTLTAQQSLWVSFTQPVPPGAESAAVQERAVGAHKYLLQPLLHERRVGFVQDMQRCDHILDTKRQHSQMGRAGQQK